MENLKINLEEIERIKKRQLNIIKMQKTLNKSPLDYEIDAYKKNMFRKHMELCGFSF